MYLASWFVAVPFLGPGVYAYTRYDTICSVPTTPVNFVSSPDSRGTLDILWSCLFTIIACTWTIQHLNVPEQHDNNKEKAGRLRAIGYDVMWLAKGFLTNLKWMLITMVAPEFILGKAIGDFVSAKRIKDDIRKFAVADKVEWGLTHGFFANMGGFVGIEYGDRAIGKDDRPLFPRSVDVPTTIAEKNPDTEPTAAEKNPDIESTAAEKNPDIEPTAAGRNPDVQAIATEKISEPSDQIVRDRGALTAYRIYWLRSENLIDKLPDITVAEIHDKSKSNIFVKVVAVIQVFWVSVEVIVRSAKGLAISQLELVVTAFSVCAIITYLFLIPKPQGVQVPMQLPIRNKVSVIGRIIMADYNVYLRTLFIPSLSMGEADRDTRIRIPNDTLYTSSCHYQYEDQLLVLFYAVGFSVGGVVFGAIHVAGWNLKFPTPIEQDLWRISSIIMTCILPLSLLPLFIFAFNKNFELTGGNNMGELGVQVVAFVFGVLYIASRLIILVEMFRTLVYLPPDAYISTWASNIPHVG